MKRIDQLTITRFLVLLLVINYHGGGGIYTDWMSPFMRAVIYHSAPSGVAYLYVLSGFVMSLIYFRPGEPFQVFAYWRTRILRIYPLYILAFLLVCLYYSGDIARIKPQKIIANLFVLQAWWPAYAQSFNYPSWSLTVEFFFYTLFPFITMWAYKRRMRSLVWISMGVWIVSQTLHFILWIGFFPEWREVIVYNPIFHLNSFVLGVVGGIWFLKEGQSHRPSAGSTQVVLIGSFLAIVGYMILSTKYQNLPHDLQPMAGLLSPIFTVFIAALAMDRTKISSVLSFRWFVALGETAYGMYILHVPVIWFFKRWIETLPFANPTGFLDITYLPLMILVGLVSSVYIDPPLRKWLKSILSDVNLPLLVLDLALIAASVYLSFRLRFDGRREFLSYRATALLMFWAAFFLRTALSIVFKTLSSSILRLPVMKVGRMLLLPVMIGSILVAFGVFAGYSAGWFTNFPRSVFLIDMLLFFGFSVILRLGLGRLQLHLIETKSSPVNQRAASAAAQD